MKVHMMSILLSALVIVLGCSRTGDDLISDWSELNTVKGSGKLDGASKNLIGDPADVTKPTTGGMCLMGGSTDVDAAFRWMISKSGGGDFVVIRATGTNAYNDYIYNTLGGVNSVETIIISKLTQANSTLVEAKIRGAEALFIAGGDQADYVKLWKNTRVENAVNFLINTKKVPVGGTSAGCAILGASYFSAVNGTVTSDVAMANPYDPLISLGHDDFISSPFLQNTITDQHFSQRAREGRLVTFMARMNKDLGKDARGIAVDEQTAVCVDQNGIASVFGLNNAFFLKITNEGPEKCSPGTPLNWLRNKEAISVYKIKGSTAGNGPFDLKNYSQASGGNWLYFYVDNGSFGVN